MPPTDASSMARRRGGEPTPNLPHDTERQADGIKPLRAVRLPGWNGPFLYLERSIPVTWEGLC